MKLIIFLLSILFSFSSNLQPSTKFTSFHYLKANKCLSLSSSLNQQFARGNFVQTFQQNYENYQKIGLKYYGYAHKYNASDIQLGNGTFGHVFLGNDDQNQTVAIKRLNQFYKWDMHHQEIFILKHIKNIKHIAHLLDVIQEPGTNTTSFVFEFINGTSLHRSARNMSNDTDIRFFSYIMLQTLAEAHQLNVIHNDLKGCNVLLNMETKLIKLLDWGISYIYQPGYMKSNIGGTVNYKAPEQLLREGFSHNFTPAVDVFGMGLLIANLMYRGGDFFYAFQDHLVLTRQIQFFGYKKITKLSALMNVNINSTVYGNFTLNRTGYYDKAYIKRNQFINKDGVSLLMKLLEVNPADRISAQEALSHRYFDPIREMVKEYENI